MAVRSISIAALAALSVLDIAAGASAETLASYKPGTSVAPRQPSASAYLSLSAYRNYVKTQADLLVGMTRVLAREIKAGELDAAQAAYAPAHRYLARIEPVARLLRDLDTRLDKRADDFEKREADPHFSGFHRIEYGLFAMKSTKDLSGHADALLDDVRALRDRLALLDLEPGVLVDGAAKLVADVADGKLSGDEERYAKSDLWDVEANIDGVHEITLLVLPQLQARGAAQTARTEMLFAQFSALLAKHKAGCGFKTYDELTKADKAALKASVVALAEELSALRGTLATN